MTILCIGETVGTIMTAGLKLVLRDMARQQGFATEVVECASVLSREATLAAANAVAIDLLVFEPAVPQVPCGPVTLDHQQDFFLDMVRQNVPVVILYNGADNGASARRAYHFESVCGGEAPAIARHHLTLADVQANIGNMVHEKRQQRFRTNAVPATPRVPVHPATPRPTHLRLVR